MMRRTVHQRGNVFAMLFASVALVGVLGATTMNVLTGPVTTVSRVTQKNLANTHMMLSARVLLNVSNDADNDGLAEPPAIQTAGAALAPVGGGLLPVNLGLSLTDPWGTGFGYCAWNHGTTNSSAGRLAGDNTSGASTRPIIAVIAAGPDKAFQTTCAGGIGSSIGVSKAQGSDDLVLTFSYAEAAASSGGLWTLNASDSNKAELKTNTGAVAVSVNRSAGLIEALAVSAATVSAPAFAGDTVAIGGGLLLDTSAGTATVCGAGQLGSLRLDAPKTGLELCDGAGAWSALRAVPTDGDKGDVTVQGGAWSLDDGSVTASKIESGAVGTTALADGAVMTAKLADGAVTFVKMQSIASERLLGRSSAGAGQIEEITLGSGLTLSGGMLSASVASEIDPEVNSLNASKWCAANALGTAIDCIQDAPAVAIADGDKGDITVSNGGAAWTIDAGAVNTAKLGSGAVTFSRIQNITASRLLGRWSSTNGSTEEISIGSGLTLSGSTLSASVAAETDPQVGAVTSGKWCRGDGSAVQCDVSDPSSVPAARLWRVLKSNAAQTGNYVNELRVYDAAGAVTVTSGMLSQSGLVAFNAAALVDNSTASAVGFHVDSSAAGSWLQIDFGAGNEKALTRWDFYTTNTVYATWAVQYYDGSAWVSARTGWAFGAGAGWQSAAKATRLAWD